VIACPDVLIWFMYFQVSILFMVNVTYPAIRWFTGTLLRFWERVEERWSRL
jgi:hypothetical protein